MFTRKQCLAKECTHDEYYLQFSDPRTSHYLLQTGLVRKARGSKDPHFNDIPLKYWDAVPIYAAQVDRMKEAGDYLTAAGRVCIAKAMVRKMVDNGGGA